MILFLDGSEQHNLRIGIIQNKTKILDEQIPIVSNSSFNMLEKISKLLQKHQLNLKSIKKIIVCAGPGSHTGIRVTASLGKGIAYGLGVELYPIKKEAIPQDISKLSTYKPKTKIEFNPGNSYVK